MQHLENYINYYQNAFETNNYVKRIEILLVTIILYYYI